MAGRLTIDLSDDLYRKVNGALQSGRETAVVFRFSRRKVVDAIVGDYVLNDTTTPRSFAPEPGRPVSRA